MVNTRPTFAYLRRQVVWCSYHSGGYVPRAQLLADPEIAQLHNGSLAIEEDVGGLQVAVEDLLRMNIVECECYLREVLQIPIGARVVTMW